MAVDDGHEELEVSADTIDEITANLSLEAYGERSSASYRRLFAMLQGDRRRRPHRPQLPADKQAGLP